MTQSFNNNNAKTSAYSVFDAHRNDGADGVRNPQAALPTRNEWRVAQWNVRTMLPDGAPELVARSLSKHEISIACLSELRIAGSGRKFVQVPVAAGEDPKFSSYELLYSGPTDGSGLYGVGLMVEKKLSHAIVDWEPINSRLARIRLHAKPFDVTVIVAYAPTEGADDEVKDEFYDQVSRACGRVKRSDYLIIGGDWNAKMGTPITASERRCVGVHAMGVRNENGERLLDFLQTQRLVASNTCFTHKAVHTETWRSNDGVTRNQIDYILVRQRWRSSVMNARVFWGTTWSSDHGLLRARLRIRFSTQRPTKRPRKFDTDSLKFEAAAASFREAVASRLAPEDYLDLAVPDKWSYIRDAVVQAASTSLGYVKRQSSQWITEQSVLLMKQREANGPQNGPALARQIKAAVRTDKNAYWASQAQEMNEASRAGSLGKLYRHIKRLTKPNAASGDVLKDAQGDLIYEPEKRMDRWVEHFRQLLNRPAPDTPIRDGELLSLGFLDVSDNPPDKKEVEMAIRSLKSGKAAGEDGIPPELWKHGGDSLVAAFTNLLSDIWSDGRIPADWGTAIVLPLFKKGDKAVCKNYRGISLLDIALKILEAIIATRIRPALDAVTRENQAGFRPGRGCIDQIFSLRQILETRHEFRRPTYVAFIDFAAAFDSVDRGSLWKILDQDGLPTKIIQLIEAMYKSTSNRVRVAGSISSDFEVATGVRQGAILSPLLFTRAIDWVMENAIEAQQLGMIVGGTRIPDLAFADDIALLAESPQELQLMLNNIATWAARVGLMVNCAKTKTMCSGDANPPQFTIYGEDLERVQSFVYLGSAVTELGDAGAEVTSRLAKAQGAFSLLQRLWNDRNVTVPTKMKVYLASVRSVLMYGCETWPLLVRQTQRLVAFEHKCWRKLLHIPYTAHVTNVEVRRRVGVLETVDVIIKRRRLSWFGHVARMDHHRLPKVTMLARIPADWRRPLGGVRTSWQRLVKMELEGFIRPPHVFREKDWRNGWLAYCVEHAQNRVAFAGTIRDIIAA